MSQEDMGIWLEGVVSDDKRVFFAGTRPTEETEPLDDLNTTTLREVLFSSAKHNGWSFDGLAKDRPLLRLILDRAAMHPSGKAGLLQDEFPQKSDLGVLTCSMLHREPDRCRYSFGTTSVICSFTRSGKLAIVTVNPSILATLQVEQG